MGIPTAAQREHLVRELSKVMEAMVAQDNLPEMLLTFYAEMELSPDDFSLRSIAADWCADNGLLDWERYLHWSVSHKVRPDCDVEGNVWDWWRAGALAEDSNNGCLWPHEKSILPDELFDELPVMQFTIYGWHSCDSLVMADMALKQALEKREYK